MPARFTAISSTSALRPETAGAFRQLYPHAELIEVYGSSETAGIAWRRDYRQSFRLLPYWQLQEQDGQWSLTDMQTAKIHPLNDRLALQEPNSEETIPSGTAAADISSDSITTSTTDSSAGRFRVMGRHDDIIQIGGNNIDMSALKKRLCTHPDIYDASVRVAPSERREAESGLSLFYYLALKSTPDELCNWCCSFEQWLNRELGDLPPPASVVLDTQVPRSALNKSVAWEPDEYGLVRGIFRSGFGAGTKSPAIDKTA